jgi:hypothetical protein
MVRMRTRSVMKKQTWTSKVAHDPFTSVCLRQGAQVSVGGISARLFSSDPTPMGRNNAHGVGGGCGVRNRSMQRARLQ